MSLLSVVLVFTAILIALLIFGLGAVAGVLMLGWLRSQAEAERDTK